MPEQLTKHPEVTLQVLRSAGARCGEGAPQDILKACPAARFCKLPGGEICVYGLPEAGQMTQVSAAEWRALLPPAPAPSGQFDWLAGGAGLALGVALVVAWLQT
jgi:hypothetical protein